jgi:hypothetical protein
MTDKKLVEFIKESRKRGYGDADIKNALINHGWPFTEIESAFKYLEPKYVNKNQITLFLSDELMNSLKKRANKNMLTMPEQIEDILRRSTLNQTKASTSEKLNDSLISLFSRKRTGPKKK